MKKGFLSIGIFIINCLFYQNAFTEEPKPAPTYTIQIVSPQSEETFQNDAQSITVSLSITPDLKLEDKVVIYIDGSPGTEPQSSTSIALPYLERGPHTLQAKIIQPQGKGAETNTITIYQQRTSKLLPAH